MTTSHEPIYHSPLESDITAQPPEAIVSASGERKVSVLSSLGSRLGHLIRKAGAIPEIEPSNDEEAQTQPLPLIEGAQQNTAQTYGYGDMGEIKEKDKETAKSYFEARTPWSSRSKIVNAITDKLESVLPLLPDSQKQASREPILTEIDTLKKQATKSREQLLKQRYNGRLIKNLRANQLPKIREEVMELQKQLGKLRQQYSAEANLELDDNSESLREENGANPGIRRQAKELGKGIAFRIGILAAIAGEDYYTPRQSKRLLDLYEQVEEMRLEATKPTSSPEEQQQKRQEDLLASAKQRFPSYFNQGWLASAAATITERLKQSTSTNGLEMLTPHEYSVLRNSIISASVLEIVKKEFNLDQNTSQNTLQEAQDLADALSMVFRSSIR